MHEIKLDTHRFNIPASFDELDTKQIKVYINLFLQYSDNPLDMKSLFLVSLAGSKAFLLNRLNEVQLAQLLVLLDWITVEKLPEYCFFREFKHKGQQYLAPLESFRGFIGFEFALANGFMNAMKEDEDKLDSLCAVIFREAGKENKWGDKRVKLKEKGIKERTVLFKDLDYRIKASALLYMSANLDRLRKKYKTIFNNEGGNDQLGWAGTFIAIAETGIVGNLDKVKETPISEICLILTKKHLEAESLKNA